MLEFLFWIVFIFIVIGYVFRLFLRYGLPWLLTRFMKNQQQKYSDSVNPNNFTDQTSSKSNINSPTGDKKKSNNDKGDFGEYVDFEDIE